MSNHAAICRTQLCRWLLVTFALAVVAATTQPLRAADEQPADADVSAQVAEWLKYSRAIFEDNHLIVRMKLEFLSGKSAPVELRYDRYPELERIQTAPGEGASFVRKKGKAWVKSDDWGETGRPVKPEQARQFDSWCSLVNAPLNNTQKSRDPSQGGTVMRLVEQVKEEGDNERLVVQIGRERQTGVAYPTFVFFRYKDAKPEQAHLSGFFGTMYLGPDKLMARIRYDYLIRVKMETVPPSPAPSPASSPSPSPEPEATPARARPFPPRRKPPTQQP